MIATQAKVLSNHDRRLEDDFIYPLAVEIFGCLHQQTYDFLHQCANMVWLGKGFGDPPLSIICSSYR
jgi:hypothetical protein